MYSKVKVECTCRTIELAFALISPPLAMNCIYMYMYMKKNISGGARQAKRSLDSTVSSLLALISREYAQLV